jgi:hypothetical protein
MVQLVVRFDQVLTAFMVTAHVYSILDDGRRDLIALRSDTVYCDDLDCAQDDFASALRSMQTWAERMTSTPTSSLSWGDLQPH